MVIFCVRVANRDERKWRKRREDKEVPKYDEQMHELLSSLSFHKMRAGSKNTLYYIILYCIILYYI